MTQLAKVELLPRPANLETHQKNIRLFHDGARRGAAELYGYAFLCGREMLLAKELVEHGQFQPWLEQTFSDIPYRTAARWMSFTEAVQAKSDTVALFKSEPKLLHNGDLSEKDCEAVLKVIPELMDGKTLTQFMRDSDLAKQPTPPGGFRPNEKAVQAWLKEHHPDLLGTKYDDLPVTVRQDFKKQYKPQLDPKLLHAARLDKASGLIDDLEQMLHDQEFKKFWDDVLRARARDLFHDFHKALCQLASKAPKKKKSKL